MSPSPGHHLVVGKTLWKSLSTGKEDVQTNSQQKEFSIEYLALFIYEFECPYTMVLYHKDITLEADSGRQPISASEH